MPERVNETLHEPLGVPMHRFRPYGPRGLIMVALAVVSFGRAVAYLVPAQPAFTPSILTEISGVIPLPVWGGLWAVTGLALLVYAPRRNQDVGLLAVIPMCTLWALLYLYAAVMRIVLDGFVESIGAFITATVYMALAVIVVALTRLINLPRRKGGDSE